MKRTGLAFIVATGAPLAACNALLGVAPPDFADAASETTGPRRHAPGYERERPLTRRALCGARREVWFRIAMAS
jgi:hypothetical protein